MFLAFCIAAIAVSAARAQTLKLVPRKASEIELAAGKRSVIFDLDDALTGTNGNLPGNPPHRYKVLFTATKDGFFYLVANVRSSSPISNKNAPCGGDSPQSVLWIKADKTLKNRELRSEIYESCSYSYYDSKVKLTRDRLVIKYRTPSEVNGFWTTLTYDNLRPEDGLVIALIR